MAGLTVWSVVRARLGVETARDVTSPTSLPASPVSRHGRRTKQPKNQPDILGRLPEVDMREAGNTSMIISMAGRTVTRGRRSPLK